MKFDAHILEYLKGKKFSNGLHIKYEYFEPIPNRVKLLSDLVRGKRVLHLGCLDHLPLIDVKIANHEWLHQELTSTASICLGIDIEREVISYVKEKHGFTNIIEGNILDAIIPEVQKGTWDFAVLGELLEHIDNPVHFLSEIRQKYDNSISKMIITVPNVLMQKNVRAMRKSSEVINSDHRYWFTPYTLAKVILQAGLELDEILFANRVPLTAPELIRKKIITLAGGQARYPFTYASSIVAIASLRNPNGLKFQSEDNTK
ncbi:MAG: methyltransferase domain-containing protein [Bacteroidetes bacterium]|nr:methyltransferase domain-containing protein [Bacteroidota bacterium]MBI3481937.1 methyltransferase domain-containing protein [Bacteroidota bacterium]